MTATMTFTTPGVPAAPHEFEWVDAAPFRALLRQFVGDTGLPVSVLAVAIGIPPRTARSLVTAVKPTRRIRWIDANAIVGMDYRQLTRDARRTGDPTRAHQALSATCPGIPPRQLAQVLRTEEWIATGLLEGWLTSCEQVVLWRALALADGWTQPTDATPAAAPAGRSV
jgi:hypothetical protein